MNTDNNNLNNQNSLGADFFQTSNNNNSSGSSGNQYQYEPPHGQYQPPHGQYEPPHGQYQPPHGQYDPLHYQYDPSHGQYGQQPVQYQDQLYAARRGQSGLGIASLIMAIFSVIIVAIIIVVGIVAIVGTVGAYGELDEDSPVFICIGLLMFGYVGTAFLSVVLGIAGFLQPNRQNTCGLIGIIVSVAFTMCLCGLMVP